jgi:hypothetical protein
MSLVDFHGRIGNTALFYAIIMAVWALWRFFRRQGLDSSYWGAALIAEILFLAQVALGLFLWISGMGQLAAVHLLYGIVSILVIPGVYVYTRGDEERRAMLIYAVSFLFLVGIVLRAIATAP